MSVCLCVRGFPLLALQVQNSFQSLFILLIKSTHKQTTHWEAYVSVSPPSSVLSAQVCRETPTEARWQGVICCFDGQLNQSASHQVTRMKMTDGGLESMSWGLCVCVVCVCWCPDWPVSFYLPTKNCRPDWDWSETSLSPYLALNDAVGWGWVWPKIRRPPYKTHICRSYHVKFGLVQSTQHFLVS